VTKGHPGGRHATGVMPWLVAGAGIVVAVSGIAFAVMLTGNTTPLGSPHNRPQATAPLASDSVTTPTPTPSRTSKSSRKQSRSPRPTSGPTATPPAPSEKPQPAASPRPSSPTPSSSVDLAATVSVDGGWHSGDFDVVVFQVQDTGSAATGQLTAAITLPAGASMNSDGRGSQGQSAADWGSGWDCQPTSTGATCQNDGIPAGGQTFGAIYITLSGTTACGQSVELAVASGSASTSAQSPSGISC
jgi:hypothetical protein